MKRILVLGLVLLGSTAALAQQAQSVWRYVDDKTGQVIYSNVQIKGKKGTKMDILEYPMIQMSGPSIPVQNNSVPVNGNAGSPIPEALLRQVQGVPPAVSLPPLPTIGAGTPSVPAGNVRLAPAIPPATAVQKEPNWAKPASGSGSPNWAKDPFEQKKIDSID